MTRAPRKKSPADALSVLRELPGAVEMAGLAKTSGLGPGDETLLEAQQWVYDAWEVRNARGRYALAREALDISPFCADAWLILSERASLSMRDRREFLERALKAGELALGKNGFAENDGHFWAVLETRPYMRARHALAEHLWLSGDHDIAIGHLKAMLQLNPGDNQGIRYVLLAWLLRIHDDAGVNEILRVHDDGSTFMSYTKALMAFRKSADSSRARRAAIAAWECNQHVAKLLLSNSVRYEDSGYYSLGHEDEAAYYVMEYGQAWKQTSGAVDWLFEVTGPLKTHRYKGRVLH